MAKKKLLEGQQTLVIAGIVVAIITALLIGAVVFRPTNLSIPDESSTSSLGDESGNSADNKTNAADETTESAEEEGPYKGWQKYNNKTWGVSARYPEGWTKNETTGGTNVAFLGPPTPAGGVILNECSFTISVETVTSKTDLQAYVDAARNEPLGGGDITNQIDTSIDGNEALKIVDTYVDVGQPWKRTRIWTIKNKKAYTFNYSASPNYGKVDYYIIHEAEAGQIEGSIIIK